MARKKRNVMENPLYTEIFLFVFWNTRDYSFPIGYQKNGVTTLEIKNSIENLRNKMLSHNKTNSPESYTNKITRMIKEGIIIKSDERVTNKKIRYIINKEWIIKTIFALIDSGYEYKNIVRKSAIRIKSYVYFQDNFLWYRLKNHCRRLYRIGEDLDEIGRKPHLLEVQQYEQRINSTIFEIIESFIYMEGFDILGNQSDSVNNVFVINFKLDCAKYIRQKLVKEHLYLKDNILYDVIVSETGILAKNRKKKQKLFQESDLIFENIKEASQNDRKN